ncbi:hypothetical protein M9458_026030, partial [Cirrhinus mrigala]
YVLNPSSPSGSVQLPSSLISATEAVPCSLVMAKEAIPSTLISAMKAVPCSLVLTIKAFSSSFVSTGSVQLLGSCFFAGFIQLLGFVSGFQAHNSVLRTLGPTTGLHHGPLITLSPRSLTSIQLPDSVSVFPGPILVLGSTDSTIWSIISQAPLGYFIPPAPSWPITTLAKPRTEPVLNPFISTGLLIRPHSHQFYLEHNLFFLQLCLGPLVQWCHSVSL